MRGASHIWFSLHTQFLPLNPHSMAEAEVVDTAVVVEAEAAAEVDPAGARADLPAEPLAAEVAE